MSHPIFSRWLLLSLFLVLPILLSASCLSGDCRNGEGIYQYPNGDIYNCHYKLYTAHPEKLGNLFEEEVEVKIPREYFLCQDFGFCNPCDSEGHMFRTLDGKVESIGGS